MTNTTSTAAANGRAALGKAQRNLANAAFAIATEMTGNAPGQCTVPGCDLAAVNTNGNGVQGSHTRPASEGHPYIGWTVPTCAGHNGAVEGAGESWEGLARESFTRAATLAPRDRDALAARYLADVLDRAAHLSAPPVSWQ